MNPQWSDWRKSNYYFFEKKLKDLSASLVLYDLGSGEEQFISIFQRFVYKPVDIAKYSEATIVADLTKTFPMADGVADIITLSNTIEHIPNPEHFFAECARILKKGGLLIGSVPFLLGEHQAPYDFNRYTHFQLQRFLDLNGFTDVEVKSLGSQIDVYNTIELKVFDELRKKNPNILLEVVRFIRRLEMRVIRMLYKNIDAGFKVTEGYGFYGVKN